MEWPAHPPLEGGGGVSHCADVGNQDRVGVVNAEKYVCWGKF